MVSDSLAEGDFVAVLRFMLTEDMNLPMGYIDGYTLCHAIIAGA
jgi:hypothetical protein